MGNLCGLHYNRKINFILNYKKFTTKLNYYGYIYILKLKYIVRR